VINTLQAHITDNKFKSIIRKKDFDNESLLQELDKKMLDASTKEGVSGIETGYKRFDVLTSGMQPTNLIIIAARPAMGKTQYALGLMKHASIRNNYKGLFISCEMDEVQVMKRVISVDSGIPGYHIKRGRLETREIMRYEKSKKRIINSNMKIVAGSFTITDVLSMVYKMKYSEGLDYVVIDYIQKIQSPGAQNRTNEVGDVSRKLKDMANELKIPVIALAQLSRAVEHRTDKKPMLSDLRESGDIEQDADIVMFLYRNGYYMSPEEKDNNPMADDGYAIIAKHRDGELEDIHLRFDANIPAWKNPYDSDEPDEDYVQTALRPNNDFDIF
jgi:replicative DNA helicase